jgi:hypothetical protein
MNVNSAGIIQGMKVADTKDFLNNLICTFRFINCRSLNYTKMCGIFSRTTLPRTILLDACFKSTWYQPMNKFYKSYHTRSCLYTDTISIETFVFLFSHLGSWWHGFHERSLETHHCSKNFKQCLLDQWTHVIRLKDSKSPGRRLYGSQASLVWFFF